jgi:hypothetical protein
VLLAQLLPGINEAYLWKLKKTREQTGGNRELLELHSALRSELQGFKVCIFNTNNQLDTTITAY